MPIETRGKKSARPESETFIFLFYCFFKSLSFGDEIERIAKG